MKFFIPTEVLIGKNIVKENSKSFDLKKLGII